MIQLSPNFVIQLQEVTKKFKNFIAVNQLSLTVKEGEYLALLGRNGAGKTTLVEMIEGLQTPDAGNITIAGMNWKQHNTKLRRIIGLSLQETKFIDKLTVIETLRLFAGFYNLPESRVQKIVEWTNLGEKLATYTVNLSGGQRQRLALGIALLNEPKLLLLDEPTTGLDPNARREIWDILLEIKKLQNTTLILTTHYMEEAERLCDRIVIMDSGKILADGTLQNLLQTFSKGEIIGVSLNRALTESQLQTLTGIIAIENIENLELLNSFTLRITVENIVKFLPNFFELLEKQGLTLLKLQAQQKTLDDLFIALTGKSLQS
jgi:ABC-2 type transport system ATP-binding protein